MRNEYAVNNDKVLIYMVNAAVIIDADDFKKVSEVPGMLQPFIHPRTGATYARFDRVGGRVLLHRLIMDTPKGQRVAHRDGNGLNCTRANMVNVPQFYTGPLPSPEKEPAPTPQEGPKKSGIKGVTWHKKSERWAATVFHEGKRHCLPYSKTVEEAAARIAEFKKERGIT